ERLLALVLHLVTKAAQLLPVALHLLGVGLVPLVEVLLALGILAIPGRELLGGGLGQLRRGDLSLLAVFGLLLDRRVFIGLLHGLDDAAALRGGTGEQSQRERAGETGGDLGSSAHDGRTLTSQPRRCKARDRSTEVVFATHAAIAGAL